MCDNNPPLFYLWCVLWLAGSAMTGAGYPKPKARICCGVASTEFGVVRHRKGGSVSVTSGVLVGVRVKDEHAKDAAQLRRALRRACHRTWRRTWASGPGRRAPSALLATPPQPPPCLFAVRAEMGAQLGSSVAFGSGCGQTLPGVPRKALLCFHMSFKGRDISDCPFAPPPL